MSKTERVPTKSMPSLKITFPDSADFFKFSPKKSQILPGMKFKQHADGFTITRTDGADLTEEDEKLIRDNAVMHDYKVTN